LTLANPVRPDLAPIEIEPIVDTGATHLAIPQHVAVQLNPNLTRTREGSLANGQAQVAPYASPIEVRFENRLCFVGGLVMGNQPLLGAIPMKTWI
jgi:predicted aspartyl protease